MGHQKRVPSTKVARIIWAIWLLFGFYPAQAQEDTNYISPLPQGSRTIANDKGRFVRCVPPDNVPTDNFEESCKKFLADMKLVRIARPIVSLTKRDWITEDDYPRDLINTGAFGRSLINISIDDAGHVTNCEVLESSGHPLLDNAACSATRQKGKFLPRIGRFGKPEPSTYARNVNWKARD